MFRSSESSANASIRSSPLCANGDGSFSPASGSKAAGCVEKQQVPAQSELEEILSAVP